MSYTLQVRDGILQWLESVRWHGEGWGKYKYNARMQRKYGLIPSANAVEILSKLNAITHINKQQKNEAVEYFQSCQDARDGYFKDPMVGENDRVENAIHSWRDIWGQMGIAAQALKILGSKPLYPMPRTDFVDIRNGDVREWMLSLNWENPWLVGEQFFRAVQAYTGNFDDSVVDFDFSRDDLLDGFFKLYETEIHDPETGMPTKKGCKDPSVAMAGLFKVMRGYVILKRPVPFAEKAIDYTLQLQNSNGEFGFGRNMCINWDAVWVLRELDKQLQGSYRHGDIVNTGNMLADALLSIYLKPDGGFAFCGEHCWPVHHSIKISAQYPIGDMTGTFMCLNCLMYADEWNGMQFMG